MEPLVTIRCALLALLCTDCNSDVIRLHCLVVSGADTKEIAEVKRQMEPDPRSAAHGSRDSTANLLQPAKPCKSQYVVAHNSLQPPIFHQFCFLSSPSPSLSQFLSFSFKTLTQVGQGCCKGSTFERCVGLIGLAA